jgi:hypothetical protein
MLIYIYSPLTTIIGVSSSYHTLIQDMLFHRLQCYVPCTINNPFRFTTDVDTRYRATFPTALILECSI